MDQNLVVFNQIMSLERRKSRQLQATTFMDVLKTGIESVVSITTVSTKVVVLCAIISLYSRHCVSEVPWLFEY